MKHLKDEEIMTMISHGKLEYTRILFDRYHIKIYNFLLKMVQDKDHSEDLTQDVFYKLIKYRTSYKEGKFSSWIYTIARNVFMDHYKSQKNKNQRLDDIDYKIQKIPEENITSKEIKEQLETALNKLNYTDKMLIVMHRYQNIKYQEIAEITDSTRGAVKTKIHRAIAKLKNHYFQNM